MIPVLILLLIGLAANPSRAADGSSVGPRLARADSLGERVAELQRAGDFRSALDTAIRRREALEAETGTSERTGSLEGMLAEARACVSTLMTVVTLPPSERRQIHEAILLDATIEDAALRGDFQGMEGAARKQRDIRSRILGPRNPETLSSLHSLAHALHARGEYAQAAPLYYEVLDGARAVFGPAHESVATAMNNLAMLLMDRGDLHQAEPLLREVLSVQRQLYGPEHERVALTLNNLAVLFRMQGDYTRAEPLCRAALAMRRRILSPAHRDIAQSLSNLAVMMRALGNGGEAEPLYREALSIRRRALGGEHPDVATTLSNLAVLVQARGDLDEAEALYREALNIERKALGPEHPAATRDLRHLASVLMLKGQSAAAWHLYAECLDAQRRAFGDEHPVIATTLQDMARLERDQRNAAEAERLFRDALSMHRRFLAPDHPKVVQCSTELGDFLRTRGRFAEAERILSEAAGHYDAARLRVEPGFARSSFLASPYGPLAATRLALGRPDLAWVDAEMTLGRSLAELLAAADGAPASPPVPLLPAPPPALAQVQAAIPERTALVGWLDADAENAWVYVIRSSGPPIWRRLEPAGGAGASVTAVRGGTSPPAEPGAVAAGRIRTAFAASAVSLLGAPDRFTESADAHALYETRIAPAMDALRDVEALIVLPSGPMLGVPVETTIDREGRFLCETFRISYAPSASILAKLRARQRSTPLRGAEALFLGDPAADAAGALPRLAWSREEVTSSAALFPAARVLLGPDASEQAWSALVASGELRRFRVIHIAAHAVADASVPARSAIHLAPVPADDRLRAVLEEAQPVDGLLTAGEVVRDVTIDADLVVLSACATATGKVVAGEGAVGWTSAFLQVGARCLLVSLWPVHDEATSLLMNRFYQNWVGRGHGSPAASAAQALQEAKEWIRTSRDPTGRARFAHPYYWSSFILVGDAS